MIDKKWGRIINISSVGGQWVGLIRYIMPVQRELLYLWLSLAKTYSKFNITCNAVSPGLVETDMTIEIRNQRKELKKLEKTPLRGLALPKIYFRW